MNRPKITTRIATALHRVLLLASVAILGLLHGGVAVASLVLPVQLTGTISHVYDVPGGPPVITDTLVANYMSFTTNLGDATSIVFEVTAPAGQRYQVTPLAGGTTSLDLNVNYQAPGGGGLNDPNMTPTVSFIDPMGVLNPTAFGSTRQAGNQIVLGASGNVPGPFSFRGIRIDFPGPFGSSGGPVMFDANSESRFSFVFEAGSFLPDPGPFVSLVAVPEPSSLACWAVLSLGLLGTRRRVC